MAEERTFTRVKGTDDNEYICPLEMVQNNTSLREDQLDDCVEADVVGRYIGHLKMVDSA